MARAVADRLWRESTPEGVERDLASLWRQVGELSTPVARAVMSNLIVFRSREELTSSDLGSVCADLPIEQVAARHPSRVIVIEHCDDPQATAPTAAAVGVLLFGPDSARYGVEQIVVRSACPDAALLSILRRFVRGDMPTSVWWTEDLSAQTPNDPLLIVGRQLVYDSRKWRDVRRGIRTVAALAADARVDVADLNWRRLAAVRDAIAHVRGAQAPAAWRTAPTRVAHAPSHAALAWLAAGWLSAEHRGGDVSTIDVAEDVHAAETLRITIGDLGCALTERAVTVTAAGIGVPIQLVVSVETNAEAIAAELRSLSPDAGLAASIAALAAFFAASA